MQSLPNLAVAGLCTLAIIGLFAAHAAVPFAFVPLVLGVSALAGAANDLRRQRRLKARGQTVIGRVTEVWLEVVNRGRSGTIWRWRVNATADVNGAPRSFVSAGLRADPRPDLDVGTELAVHVDPATSTYEIVLPDLPGERQRAHVETSIATMRHAVQRRDPIMQRHYGTIAGIVAACLIVYDFLVFSPITLPVIVALLVATAWFLGRAYLAGRFEQQVATRGVTFQVPVLHVTRRHQASAFGSGNDSWIISLQGQWPDGHAQLFTVRTKDQGYSLLRPGDLVTLQGDPATRAYALA